MVRAQVISRLARAATLGDAKPLERDSPAAMLQGPGNRCLETMDGSMRGKALFPILGDNVVTQDSPSLVGYCQAAQGRASRDRQPEEMSVGVSPKDGGRATGAGLGSNVDAYRLWLSRP